MRERSASDGRARLLADAMLGGLAKWLRILGLDVAYDPELDDAGVVDRAREEDRWILTRDRRLVKRREARDRHLLIDSVHVPEQVRQVVDALDLDVDRERLFSRCVRCNRPLEPIPAAEARSEVPPYVAKTQDRFRQCPDCERIFWPATHVGRMRKKLDRWGVLPDGA
ncbi:MAG: Mut7-C RNAse domain-containing protein [Thermoanaerobaculia bacterium]|nr:Mut7-C RNAse domain-containing protein [Thermoanaerobaculia bacterium]